MKRFVILVLMMLVLAGCGTAVMDKNQPDLTIQLPKKDEEAGVEITDDHMYAPVKQFSIDNPKYGTPNNLSIYIVGTSEEEDTNYLVLFLINRLETPIKNISFDYTLGIKKGDLAFDDVYVLLDEAEYGEIKADHVMPFSLEIDDKQLKILEDLTDENHQTKFNNVDLEEVE